jgi:diguanylate cyclase (GGDEF)-like protein
VLSSRSEVLGALSAVLDLSTLAPRMQGIVRGSPVEVVVLATDGTPLLSTSGAATTLARLDPREFAVLRGQAGELMLFQGLHEREALGVADVPRSLPVVVVAERDRAEVFAAWREQLRFFVLLVAGLMLLVGAVAYWMGRSIVAPLGRLTAAAESIARGDLSVTLRDESADEIGRLTRVFTAMTDRLRASHAEVEAANRTLRQQNELLATLAITDSLTGLDNRKRFDEILAEQFAVFRRTHDAFALLLLAIDNLKAINVDYGLVAGDDVLAKVAAILKQAVRPDDHVARFAGETFAAVLTGTPMDAAMDIAERVRNVVEAPDFLPEKQTIKVTVSIGVAQSREGDDGPETIVFRADHALHESERAGGNRVQSAL